MSEIECRKTVPCAATSLWAMAAWRWLASMAVPLALAALAMPAAANNPMIFNRIGPQQGLSQGGVMAIAQDSRGFLWLGTEDGLNRYDGYELTHIFRERGTPGTLPNNWVSALLAGADGRLWVGMDGGGAVWRDPNDGLFHTPVAADGADWPAEDQKVRKLFMDRKGKLWVATREDGLKVLASQGGILKTYRHDPQSVSSLSSDSVYDLTQDETGSIWVATQTGLDRIDPESGQVERHGSRLAALASQEQPDVIPTVLALDRRGILWIGSNIGLARLDPHSLAVQVYRRNPGDPESLPEDRVTALLEDDENRLWVGTAGGLALLDRRTGNFTVYRHDAADPSSLPNDYIITLHQDRGGLIWVGTKSGGAASWNPRSWSFGHRRIGGSAGQASQNITSFAEDTTGRLWVGTFGGGLYGVDRRGDNQVTLRQNSRDPNGLSDDNVMALATGKDGAIWIGTMRAGVERFDPRTGRLTHFRADPGNPAALPAPGIMSLLADSRGHIWVGTYGGGLARIDPASGTVRRYPGGPNHPDGLSSDRATAIAEDRSGLIWIGTDGGGLNVLDPDSGRIRFFRHSSSDPGTLGANTVYAIHVDDNGRVWVGTRGGGLDRVRGGPFSPGGVTFENYSEREGLPNSTVYGIQSDASGKLWLSTNRGIAQFDPLSGKIRSFRRNHGLQADEFNFGAHYRAASGELFFGGQNGYNEFFADRLRFSDRPPPVTLTAIRVNNVLVDVGTTHSSVDKFDLGYDDDVLTFEFAALDFASPADNRYAYMLEGFDTEWIDAGARHTATYTDLRGGDYLFQVRASNSDGSWNETGMALALKVAPAPWATWWAYCAYAMVFALMLYGVWAAQQRKVLREVEFAKRLQDEVTERTTELAQRNEQLEQANEQLREASVTDPLTGLGNRRALRDSMTSLANARPRFKPRSQKDPQSVVLMLVDLDHLKPINDQHGHDAGDRLLIAVAQILKDLCRTSDQVVRWGGDEFVIACNGTDLKAACVLAERIRSSVAKQLFRLEAGKVARTSCTVGFASFPFVDTAPFLLTWEQSLAMADAALYYAKRKRNTWCGVGGTPLGAGHDDLLQAAEARLEELALEGCVELHEPSVQPDDITDSFLTMSTRSGRT